MVGVVGPIKFRPILKERVWGSNRLGRVLGKSLPAGVRIGESWELADLPGACSAVAEGPWAGWTWRKVLEQHGGELGFTAAERQAPFGLLLKFLDAAEKLSVQVHPDEEAARTLGGEAKTECWYVIEARPGAVIYRGLKEGVGRAELAGAVRAGRLEELLEMYAARAGDFHFLPAGTVHALGAGVVAAEVQTPSDTTYRLYDWDRRNEKGRGRALHVEESLASILYPDHPPTAGRDSVGGEAEGQSEAFGRELQGLAGELGQARLLASCRHFNVAWAGLAEASQASVEASRPAVMMVLRGAGWVGVGPGAEHGCAWGTGDTLLLPGGVRLRVEVEKGGECLLASLGWGR